MNGMELIEQAIKEYKEKNGSDYDRILISETFLKRLYEESSNKGPKNVAYQVSSGIIDIPRMEIKKNVNYDFKLLP